MRSNTSFVTAALLVSSAVAAPAGPPQDVSNQNPVFPSPKCDVPFPKVAEYDAYQAFEKLKLGIKPDGETITVPVGGEMKGSRGLDALDMLAKARMTSKMTEKSKRLELFGQQNRIEHPDFVIAGRTCELAAAGGAAAIWICNDKPDKQNITWIDAVTYAELAHYGSCRVGDEEKGWEPFAAQIFHKEKWNLIIRKNDIKGD